MITNGIISILALIGSLFGHGPAIGGTIATLDQWTSTSSPVSAITQRQDSKAVKLTGLTPGGVLSLDSERRIISTSTVSGTTTFDNITVTGTTTTGSLVANYISTGTCPSGNSFSVDGSTLLVDCTNHRVGIGSSTPLSTLSVSGSGTTNPFTIASSTNLSMFRVDRFGTVIANKILTVSTDNDQTSGPAVSVGTGANSSNYAIGVSGGRAMIGFDTTNGALNIEGGSSKAVQIYGNQVNNVFTQGGTPAIYVSGGVGGSPANTVGISSTTPYATFAVSGIASSTFPAFTVASSSGNTMLSVSALGNLGIGTTSPSARLAITGSGTGTGKAFAISDSNDRNVFNVQDNGVINFGVGGGGQYSITPVNGSSDVALGSAHFNSQFGVWVRSTSASVRQNGFDAAVSGNLAFKVGGNDNLLNILSTGKVGIGTTSPAGPLQVVVPAWTNRDTDSQHVIIGNGTAGGSANGVRFGYNNSTNNGYINVLQPGVAWGNLILQDAGLGGGKVGIGTTSPVARLSVAGSGTGTGISFQTTNSSNSPMFSVLDNGKVGIGIGTSAPGSQLTVGGDLAVQEGQNENINILSTRRNSLLGSGAGVNIYASLPTGTGFPFNVYGAIVFQGRSDATNTRGGFAFVPNSTTGVAMVVDNLGNVGIGSSTPKSNLSIQGSGGQTQSLFSIASSTGVPLVTVDAVDGTWHFGNNIVQVVNPAGNGYLAVGGQGIIGSSIGSTNSTFSISGGSNNDLLVNGGSGTGGISFSRQFGPLFARFNYDGRLSIGTTSASAKVSIQNAYGSTTPLFDISTTTSSAFATSSIFTVLSSGNVGIGTSTPPSVLSLGSGSIYVPEYVPATSTSMTISWTDGNQQLIKNGTAGLTVSFSNYSAGQRLALVICNGPSTAGTISFPNVNWAGGTAPTLTTTANKCDLMTFLATNGTSTLAIFGGYNQNY